MPHLCCRIPLRPLFATGEALKTLQFRCLRCNNVSALEPWVDLEPSQSYQVVPSFSDALQSGSFAAAPQVNQLRASRKAEGAVCPFRIWSPSRRTLGRNRRRVRLHTNGKARESHHHREQMLSAGLTVHSGAGCKRRAAHVERSPEVLTIKRSVAGGCEVRPTDV